MAETKKETETKIQTEVGKKANDSQKKAKNAVERDIYAAVKLDGLPKSVVENIRKSMAKNIGMETLQQDTVALQKKSQSLYDRYKNDEYVDPTEYDDLISQTKALQDRYGKYRQYVSTFSPNEDSSSIQSAIDGFTSSIKGFGSLKDYYSRFSDADDYAEQLAQGKEYDRLLNYDLEAGKASLDAISKKIDDAKALSEQYATMLPVGEAITAEEKAIQEKSRAAGEALPSLVEEYSHKEKEYNLAEKAQYLRDAEAIADREDFKAHRGFVDPGTIEDPDEADTIYYVINNTDRKAYIPDFLSPAPSLVDELLSLSSLMTQKEKGIFNYIYNQIGKEEANEYINALRDTISYRQAQISKGMIDTIVPDNALGEILEVPIYFGAGFYYGAKDAIPNLVSGLTNKEMPVSVGQNVQSMMQKDGNAVSKFSANLGQSIGNMMPSIILSSVLGGYGLPETVRSFAGAATMGLQARGAAYNETLRQGYSKEQASFYATVNGALESSLQAGLTGISKLGGYVPGKIKIAIQGINSATGRFLANYAVSMASEALEEGLQAIIDPYVRRAILYEDADIDWGEVGYSALLGAASAGFLEIKSNLRESKLSQADMESIKTKYDIGNSAEKLFSLFEEERAVTLRAVTNLVSENKTKEAQKTIDAAMDLERRVAEYAKRKYGDVSFNTKTGARLSIGETSKQAIRQWQAVRAKVSDGSFNAASADASLRESSNVWKEIAKRSDKAAAALLNTNMSNTKIEKNVLDDPSVVAGIASLTGVDLSKGKTVSQKRALFRQAAAAYQALTSSGVLSQASELIHKNNTETDAVVRSENIRGAQNILISYGRELGVEKQSLQNERKTLSGKEGAIRREAIDKRIAEINIQQSMLSNMRNHIASGNLSALASLDGTNALNNARTTRTASVETASTETAESVTSDEKASISDELDIAIQDIISQLDPALVEELQKENGFVMVRSDLEREKKNATKEEAAKIGEEIDLVRRLEKLLEEKQYQLDTAGASFRESVIQEVSEEYRKKLATFGIDLRYDGGGDLYFDENGNPLTAEQYREALSENKKVRVLRQNGYNSERTVGIFRALASSNVRALDLKSGTFRNYRVGSSITVQDAVNFVIGHEVVHAAATSGRGDLIQTILSHIEGTRLDREFEIFNRRNGRPVSEKAADRFEKLRNSYQTMENQAAKNNNREPIKVDDNYLFEEIAADYMGSLMMNQGWEEVVLRTATFGEKVRFAMGRLSNKLRKNNLDTRAKLVDNLATRLERASERTYGNQEKRVAKDDEIARKKAEDDARREEEKAARKAEQEAEKQKKGQTKEPDAEETSESIIEDGVTVDKKGEPVAEENGEGSVRLSISTFEETGRDALSSYLSDHISDTDLSQEDADSILQSMDEIYKICKSLEGEFAPFGAWSRAKVEVDKNGNPVFSVVKQNGEYALNLDFSLVCKKRRALDAVFNRLIETGKINTFDFGQEEIVKINEIIRTHGFEVACALCFVDAKRFRQAKVSDDFVSMYNGLVKSLDKNGVGIDYFNFGNDSSLPSVKNALDTMSDNAVDFSKIDKVLAGGKTKTVIYKIALHLKNNPQDRKLLSRGDFMSSRGFGEVKKNKPEILSLYNSKKGSGGPKASFGDVQYLNEIIGDKKFNAEDAYDVGGVRIQSFSDYVARLVFDYVQMVGDLAAKKLPAHAYTKETLFAKQFGLTGIKINMSLIPDIGNGKHAGLNADGSYAWASESFPVDEAYAIQNDPEYGKNCGTIAVGVSDEHILKLLEDPNIRMVIPYHKSGINPLVAHMLNIDGFTNYTNFQNTRYKDGKKLSDADAAKVPNFNKLMHEEGLTAVEASKRYVTWCEERGYLPKFSSFAYTVKNGKRVFNENYYKLLEDFTTMVNGESVPQQAVTATFPDETSAFGSMKDLIREGLDADAVTAAALDDDVDSMVEEISDVLNKGEKRYSIAGIESETADISALDEALRRYRKGDKREDIIRDTGWWLGKDGKWRYEISDEDMDFERDGFVKNPKTVGDYVKHDKLFKAYPDLKNIKVQFVKKVGNSDFTRGGFSAEQNTIYIKKTLPSKRAKKTMLHELQHAIQDAEGFKRGSSIKNGAMLVFNELYDAVKDYPRFQSYKSPALKMRYVMAMSDIELGNSHGNLAREAYKNDYGEIEARAAVERMDMTDDDLKNTPYFNDGIVTDNDQIKQDFIDNLIEIGYTERKAKKIAEEGIQRDYQLEDDAKPYAKRSTWYEGERKGSRFSNVSRDRVQANGSQSEIYGTGEISDSDAVAEKNGNGVSDGRITESEDTRYSLFFEEETPGLSYEKLQSDVENAEDLVRKVTAGLLSQRGSVDAVGVATGIHKMLTTLSATVDSDEITADAKSLLDYIIRNTKNGEKPDGAVIEEVVKRSREIAEKIFNDTVDVDATAKEFQEVGDLLRKTQFYVPAEQRSDGFEEFGGYNDFRMKFFGSARLSGDGIGKTVSEFYGELAEAYPELFPDSITDAAEQAIHIANLSRELRSADINSLSKSLFGQDVILDIQRAIVGFLSNPGSRAAKDFSLAVEIENTAKKIDKLVKFNDQKTAYLYKKFGDKLKKASEGQRKAHQEKMIRKRAKTMMKRIIKPSAKNHIPQKYSEQIGLFLSSLVWTDKNQNGRDMNDLASKTREAVYRNKNAEEKLNTSVRDEDAYELSSSLVSEMEAFNGKRVDELTSEELKRLNQILQAVSFAVREYNTAITYGGDLAEKSEKAMQRIALRSKNKKANLAKDVMNGIEFSYLDARAFADILNVPEISEAIDSLGKGQDEFYRDFTKMTEEMKSIVGEEGIPDSWRDDIVSIKLANGKTFSLTQAQLMSFYLLSKQELSRKRLLNPGGGAVSSAVIKGGLIKKKVTDKSDIFHFTEADVDSVIEKLDPKAREMADKISGFLNGMVASIGNEASMKNDGYLRFVEENYFPMLVAVRDGSYDDITNAQHEAIMDLQSILKERKNTKSVTLLVDDVFSVLNRHILSMAQYAAYSGPIRDLYRLMRIRPTSGDTLLNVIERNYGDKAAKFTDKLIRSLQGRQMLADQEQLPQEKLLSKWKLQQVLGSLSTVLKQPLSFVRAIPEFNAKYLALKPLAFGSKEYRAERKEMLEMNPIAGLKAMGFSEYARSRSVEEFYNNNAKTKFEKAQDILGVPAEEMDILTLTNIWRMCKKEFTDVDGNVDYEAAKKKFRLVVERTQVVQTALTSAMGTDANTFTKMIFAFKNEAFKQLNYLKAAAANLDVEKPETVRKFATTSLAFVASAFLESIVSNIFATLRSEEDDEEELLKSVFNLGLVADAIFDMLGTLTLFAGDISDAIKNIMQGYDPERTDYSLLSDMISVSRNIINSFGKETKYGQFSLYTKLANNVAGLFGVPLRNILRYIKTPVLVTSNIFEGTEYQYLVKKWFYNVDGYNTSAKAEFQNVLASALDKGNFDDFAAIRSDLRSHGFSEKDIQTAVGNSDRFYNAFNEGPAAFREEVAKVKKHDSTMTSEYIMESLKNRKTKLINDLYTATKSGDKDAIETVTEEILNMRDVAELRKLTKREVQELLKNKVISSLKTKLKESCVMSYGTEHYQKDKDLVLAEFKEFNYVTSSYIDMLVRELKY